MRVYLRITSALAEASATAAVAASRSFDRRAKSSASIELNKSLADSLSPLAAVMLLTSNLKVPIARLNELDACVQYSWLMYSLISPDKRDAASFALAAVCSSLNFW